MKKIITLLFLVFGLHIMIAQSTTSSIKGTVKSSDTELLPGTSILAIHTPTGSKYSALSNAEGRFSMINMRVGGPYKIMVTYIGFRTQQINDVF
ncbi:MAG: carboxypeptidase-like regulatory domain-containing protein, partial [Flavobacterium sp.]